MSLTHSSNSTTRSIALACIAALVFLGLAGEGHASTKHQLAATTDTLSINIQPGSLYDGSIPFTINAISGTPDPLRVSMTLTLVRNGVVQPLNKANVVAPSICKYPGTGYSYSCAFKLAPYDGHPFGVAVKVSGKGRYCLYLHGSASMKPGTAGVFDKRGCVNAL